MFPMLWNPDKYLRDTTTKPRNKTNYENKTLNTTDWSSSDDWQAELFILKLNTETNLKMT